MFTAEQALDAMGTTDAIIIDAIHAAQLLARHCTSLTEYLEETGCWDPEANHDAGELLAWLGY